jgi:hypothetical protein
MLPTWSADKTRRAGSLLRWYGNGDEYILVFAFEGGEADQPA